MDGKQTVQQLPPASPQVPLPLSGPLAGVPAMVESLTNNKEEE